MNNGWDLTIPKDDLNRMIAVLKGPNKIIEYPSDDEIFKSFYLTPFNKVKVVIIGQDPYPKLGQANGLAFSVNKGQKIPKSLQNIFKEIKRSVKWTKENEHAHGDLTQWAEQGVLLLNSILTVEKDKSLSHKGLGWEEFTDGQISRLANERSNLIFMFWGNEAKKKKVLMNEYKDHLFLEASHPAATKGFLGCNHFILANEYLKLFNFKPIDWSIYP